MVPRGMALLAKPRSFRTCAIAGTIRANMESGRVIHIGRIDFRNDDRLFGIKHEDRFSHVYIIGKTGTGKSTLLETMALQDLECGNGFALIDPHGDLVSRIAARIPTSQRNRVIYLNTTDPSQPYGYNPLRHVAEDRIALAASGMIDVFKKMWPRRALFATDVRKANHGALKDALFRCGIVSVPAL
jgi:hypothetical protein